MPSNLRNKAVKTAIYKKDVTTAQTSSSKSSLNSTGEGEDENFGRDEMNLVEYPFASLWRGDTRGAVIELEWQNRHPKTGAMLNASWRVAGHAKLGLPTASDERLYLVLMALTKEQGIPDQVMFSRYNALQRLGWPDNAKHYQMLRDAFERLQGVNIHSDNCFWDAEAQNYRSTGFPILDGYSIVDEKVGRKAQGTLPMSWFRWSQNVQSNFKAGYIKSLNLDFALSLKKPLSLRLYRYLDKKRGGVQSNRASFQIGLQKLCEYHLGMEKTPYPSTLKHRLKPAHEELQRRGFLKEIDFEKMRTQSGEKVVYSFGLNLLPAESTPLALPEIPTSQDDLAEAMLLRFAEDDPAELARIEAEARECLGDVETALLARDPENEAALHTLRMEMREIVKETYRNEFA